MFKKEWYIYGRINRTETTIQPKTAHSQPMDRHYSFRANSSNNLMLATGLLTALSANIKLHLLDEVSESPLVRPGSIFCYSHSSGILMHEIYAQALWKTLTDLAENGSFTLLNLTSNIAFVVDSKLEHKSKASFPVKVRKLKERDKDTIRYFSERARSVKNIFSHGVEGFQTLIHVVETWNFRGHKTLRDVYTEHRQIYEIALSKDLSIGTLIQCVAYETIEDLCPEILQDTIFLHRRTPHEIEFRRAQKLLEEIAAHTLQDQIVHWLENLGYEFGK